MFDLKAVAVTSRAVRTRLQRLTLNNMARFRAFDSDASSSDEEPQFQDEEVEKASNREKDGLDEETTDYQSDEGDESSDSDGSSAAMLEEELIEGWRETSSRPRRALTQDANGDFQVTGDDEDDDIHRSGSETSSTPSSPTAEPRPTSNIIPWARHVGVDAQKMHVMQTSLFRMPEEAAALKALNNQPPKATNVVNMNRKHSRDSEAGEGLRADSREVRRRVAFVFIVLTLYPSALPSRTISSLRCCGLLANMHALR